MHKVVIVLAIAAQSFPVGTTSRGISVSLGNSSQNVGFSEVLTAAPYSVTFDDVPAGDYVATAQAIDADGNPLGAAVTANIIVEPDAVQVDIPASISVTVL
jgi:hypothetical protein